MSYERELYDKNELGCMYCDTRFEPLGFQTELKEWYLFNERAESSQSYSISSSKEGVAASMTITRGSKLFKYIRQKGYRHMCVSCFATHEDSGTVKSIALAVAGDGEFINAHNQVLLLLDE